MKIGEALSLRKDIRNRISSLLNRINKNAVTKEGEEPAEEVDELISEALKLCDEEAKIIYAIHNTNAKIMLDDDKTLMEALIERDIKTRKSAIILNAVNAATQPGERYSQTELKDIRHVDVKLLQKEIEKYAKEARELDLKIQEKNWTTDLL